MDKRFTLAILDLDPLVYACGFSIQKTNKETGEIECEPVKHAFYNVNHMVRKILHTTNAQSYKGFITSNDKSNFRFGIYPHYKENRTKCADKCEHPYTCGHEKISTKPIYYNEIREFIVKRWNADVVTGMEADDACSILQYESNPFGFDPEITNSVVCSIDKDFDNIPGWHYNSRKDEVYYVEPIQALRNFYLQILTGDTSDNIPRIKKGWRSKKVEEKLTQALTEEEMYNIIYKEAYKIIYPDDKFKDDEELSKHHGVRQFIRQNGQLVHLLKERNMIWQIPETHLNQIQQI